MTIYFLKQGEYKQNKQDGKKCKAFHHSAGFTLFSRMQIEELILKFNPTMIMAEHDKMFTEHTAARIIHL